jgi:uncharacterized protein DUF4167
MEGAWPRFRGGSENPSAALPGTGCEQGKRDSTRMNMKRMRGRPHRGSGNGSTGSLRHHGGGIPLNRNHVFDSNGPDVRLRGTAQQLFEKYLQLGRDATSGGDRVLAESCFQHAEHYFRILNAMMQAAAQQNAPNGQHGGPPRRPPGMDAEAEDDEQPPVGSAEQPTEPREIPISASPPES